MREKSSLDTTKQEPNALAPFTLAVSQFRNGFAGLYVRKQRLRSTEGSREKLEQAGTAEQPLQAGLLVHTQRPAKQSHSLGPRECCEENLTVEFSARTARVTPFNLCSCGFDQLPVV